MAENCRLSVVRESLLMAIKRLGAQVYNHRELNASQIGRRFPVGPVSKGEPKPAQSLLTSQRTQRDCARTPDSLNRSNECVLFSVTECGLCCYAAIGGKYNVSVE